MKKRKGMKAFKVDGKKVWAYSLKQAKFIAKTFKEILDEEAKYNRYKSQKKHPTLNYVLTGERPEHNAEYEERMLRDAERAKARKDKAKEFLGKAAKTTGNVVKELASEAKEFGEGVDEGAHDKPPKRSKVHVFSKEVDEDFFQEGYA